MFGAEHSIKGTDLLTNKFAIFQEKEYSIPSTNCIVEYHGVVAYSISRIYLSTVKKVLTW